MMPLVFSPIDSGAFKSAGSERQSYELTGESDMQTAKYDLTGQTESLLSRCYATEENNGPFRMFNYFSGKSLYSEAA